MSKSLRSLASSGWKFIVVGVLNNVVGYSIFALLSLLAVAAVPAMVFSYVVGMIISFFGNRSFTFRHQGGQKRAILRFLVVNLGGMTLNAVILWIFVDVMHYPQLLVQIGAIGCVAILTFTLMRMWVFQHDAEQAEIPHA
ncbi:GtrA family protein [Psychromicrobium xiongbiense]|uniref:GtrA family protein n=1 Tax=Psychromicrobium xiongbiense TaxID=3051184 RepID=UPI0025576F70|nr:GtrA family protein [Psychromicrobium sp. YIM S02556]